MKRLLIPLLCLLVTMLFALPVAAAPGVRDSLKGEARTAFDDGTRLYKDNKFDEARARFEAAYKESGDRRLLFNVAVCEKAVGRNANAVRALEESLADKTGLAADYITRAKEALTALREHVSMLTVETSVPDAKIRVDGADVTTMPVLVDEGPHVVTAEKAGFEQATEKVTVQGGQPSRVALALVASAVKVARLRVTSDRAEDTMAIDDRPRVLGPLDVDLEPGEHKVLISRPGGASKTVSITLRAGETRDLRLSLPEEKKGISAWWFIIGGVLVAGAATAAVLIATQPTKFEGTTGGTLNPAFVPASYRGELR